VPKCRICLRDFKRLHFKTERIGICARCVNSLNESAELAEAAQARIADMLRRGMVRNATADLDADEPWKRRRAQVTLSHLDAAQAHALPDWLTKLLKNPSNTGRDFKIMRAYRRGLLHFDPPKGWSYPPRWPDVAARIRTLDGYRCTRCGGDHRLLDVHHIVYVSNFGTHRQENLATLCRPCHEAEHGRQFDFGEAPDDKEPAFPPRRLGSPSVIAPASLWDPTPQSASAPAPAPAPAAQREALKEGYRSETIIRAIDCPRCAARFRVAPNGEWKVFETRCPKCQSAMWCFADGSVHLRQEGQAAQPVDGSLRRDLDASAQQRQAEALLRQRQEELASIKGTEEPQAEAEAEVLSSGWSAPERLVALLGASVALYLGYLASELPALIAVAVSTMACAALLAWMRRLRSKK